MSFLPYFFSAPGCVRPIVLVSSSSYARCIDVFVSRTIYSDSVQFRFFSSASCNLPGCSFFPSSPRLFLVPLRGTNGEEQTRSAGSKNERKRASLDVFRQASSRVSWRLLIHLESVQHSLEYGVADGKERRLGTPRSVQRRIPPFVRCVCGECERFS